MTRKSALILWVSTVAVLFSLSALAQDEKRKVFKQGKTVYNFDEVDIMGRLKKPEGESVVEAPEFRFRRLLDLDEDFTPNIIRSVDEF